MIINPYLIFIIKKNLKLREFINKYSSFFASIPNDTMDVIKSILKPGKRFEKALQQLQTEGKGDSIIKSAFEEIIDDIAEENRELGIEQGIEQGIKALIEGLLENYIPIEKIKQTLINKFDISEEAATTYLDKYASNLNI